MTEQAWYQIDYNELTIDINTSTTTTTSSSSTYSTNSTILLLIDNDINIKSTTFKLLKLKFHNQQLGKLLWLKNRELHHQYEYIPIEFSKDYYFVSNFLKRMNENRKENKFFRFNRYESHCIDILSPELKKEIDFTLYSKISLIRGNPKQSPKWINRICSESETKCIEFICTVEREVVIIDCFINDYIKVFPFIDKLWTDETLLLKCISLNYKVFKFVAAKANKYFNLKLILKCLHVNPKILQYIEVSPHSRFSIFNNKPLIMKLFQSIKKMKTFKLYSERIYNKLSPTLKNDREIALIAAEKGIPVLMFSRSIKLRYDKEVVLRSIRATGYFYRHNIVGPLRNDREIMLACADLESTCDKMRLDREFMLESVKKYPRKLSIASNELQSNREFILECVKSNGLCLEYAIPQFKSDIEIVIEAIRQNPFIIKDVNIASIISNNSDCKKELLNSIDLMHLKYAENSYSYTWILERINDLDIAMKLIESNPLSIHFLNDKFRVVYPELTLKSTLLHSGYWMKHSETAFQQRINHAYYSAKIDSNEINYYRNKLTDIKSNFKRWYY